MSHQHIRAWQALLQRLSQLKDDRSGPAQWLQHCELAVAALKHVEGLQVPVPRAVLKKFVQEAQVGRFSVVFAALSRSSHHCFYQTPLKWARTVGHTCRYS